MITVRLEPELEKSLDRRAAAEGITKSTLIRKSVINYLESSEAQNPYLSGKGLFGQFSSDEGNISVNAEKILRARFRNKRK